MGASLPCRRLPGHWQQHSRHVGARIIRERLDKYTNTVLLKGAAKQDNS